MCATSTLDYTFSSYVKSYVERDRSVLEGIVDVDKILKSRVEA